MRSAGAALHGPYDLRIEDRTPPRPSRGQVFVEIAAIGICGSDVHYYGHKPVGDYVVRDPMVIGHESAGIVVEVGEGVDPAPTWELVALEPGVSRRHCQQCLQSRHNLCPRIVFFATPPVDGSITRHVAMEAAFAHRAPPALTVEQAAAAELVPVGVCGARKYGFGGGDRVLATGAGPIGLLAALVARDLEAEVPLITDVSDFRLERPHWLGLQTCQADVPLEEEFDVLRECSGVSSALSIALAVLAVADRAALVGMGAHTVPLDVLFVQSRELLIAYVFRYANTDPFVLISSGA